MKKAKKITAGIVLSTILGSSAIAAGVNIINTQLSNNSISNNVEEKKIENKAANSNGVDYDNHTVNGVQLHQSNELITISSELFDIYTNFDKNTNSFPTNGKTYIMVFFRPALADKFKYLEPQSPFYLYDQDNARRRYVLCANNLSVSKDQSITLFAYTQYSTSNNLYYGDGKGFTMQYSLPGDALSGVTISGNNSYYFGDTINLQSSASTRYPSYKLPPDDLGYEWYQVIDGTKTRINGQTTSNLSIVTPKVPSGKKLEIVCKVTYRGKTVESSPYLITFKKQVLSNLQIKSEDIEGVTYPVTVGETITVNSTYDINAGTKPSDSEITYKWYFIKNGVKNLILNQNSSTLTYKPLLEDNGKDISLEIEWNGQTLTSVNQIQLLVTAAPSEPIISNVEIEGKKKCWEDENIKLTATPYFNQDFTPGANDITYEWIQILDGEKQPLPGQTTATLNIPVPKVENGSELSYICKATYKNKSKASTPYEITVMKRKLTNLIISNSGSSSSSIQVKENESITLNSSYDVDHGNKPSTSDIRYQWCLIDKSGRKSVIPGQTKPTLTWTPSLYDSGKSILLEATWNGTTVESSNSIYLVVGSNNPDVPIDPNNPNNSGGSTNQSNDDGGIPSYVWYIVAGVGALVVIGIIVAIILISKKKKEQQRMAAKKMNVARPNTPRLGGGNALPHSGPQGQRPMNGPVGPNGRPGPQGQRPMNGPNPGPNGPVGPNAKPGMPQAKPGAPVVPGARPGVGAQRPGMQKPTAPPPPKVTVNAPPKSLAPKRK